LGKIEIQVIRLFFILSVTNKKTEKIMKIATVLALVAGLAGLSLTSCGSAPEIAPAPAPSIEIPTK